MYICVFLNLKLHDILGHINRHVSCLQKMQISFNYFFYILDFVLVKLFIFFLDIVSIVAKTTKFLVRIPYFRSIVPHIKKKKSIVSRINVRKMILKFIMLKIINITK